MSTAGPASGWAANGSRTGIGRKPLPRRTAAKMQNGEVSLWIVDVAGCETLICASRSPVGRRAGHAMGRTNCTLSRYMQHGGVVAISRPDGKMSSAT